jgi:hypothetical protein
MLNLTMNLEHAKNSI